MTSSSPEIIYIAGYGRSGSTILDILLSQERQVFGAGELFFLFDDWLSGERRCSCGELYSDCSFWSDLGRMVDIEKALALQKNIEHHGQLQDIRDGLLSQQLREPYEIFQTAIFSYIKEKSGCQIVIDSSKTKPEMSARPLALDRLTSQPLKMIHLVRDGRQTVQTILKKGSNWSLEGHRQKKRWRGPKATFGWKKANQWAVDYQSLLLPGRYIRLHYEQLQLEPEKALKEIERALGLNLPLAMECLTSSMPLDVGHRVGGNRIRFKEGLSFNRSPEPLERLSPFQELVFSLTAGKLSQSLGYR